MKKAKLFAALTLSVFLFSCAALQNASQRLETEIANSDIDNNPKTADEVLSKGKIYEKYSLSAKPAIDFACVDYSKVSIEEKKQYLPAASRIFTLSSADAQITYFMHVQILKKPNDSRIFSSDNVYRLMFSCASPVYEVSDSEGNNYRLENINDNTDYIMQGYLGFDSNGYAVSFTQRFLKEHAQKGIVLTLYLDKSKTKTQAVDFHIPPFYIQGVLEGTASESAKIQ